MGTGQLTVHLTIIFLGMISYLVITLNHMDGTPLLTMLGGYLGARTVDVAATVIKNGNGHP